VAVGAFRSLSADDEDEEEDEEDDDEGGGSPSAFCGPKVPGIVLMIVRMVARPCRTRSYAAASAVSARPPPPQDAAVAAAAADAADPAALAPGASAPAASVSPSPDGCWYSMRCNASRSCPAAVDIIPIHRSCADGELGFD